MKANEKITNERIATTGKEDSAEGYRRYLKAYYLELLRRKQAGLPAGPSQDQLETFFSSLLAPVRLKKAA